MVFLVSSLVSAQFLKRKTSGLVPFSSNFQRVSKKNVEDGGYFVFFLSLEEQINQKLSQR